MIKKFKNFDAGEFLKKKEALKESISQDDEKDLMEMPDEDDIDGINKEDVITGKAVYDDPYLLKITKIILNRLDKSNLGKFGVYHDIIYMNGIPGVWFYDYDGKVDIVCCRNRNKKVIAVFNNFEVNNNNRSIITYSTEKIGFRDMLDQMIDELHNSIPVNEGLIVEAGGFGDGYSETNIKNFMKLMPSDKRYIYDLVSTKKKGDAILHMKSGLAKKDPTILRILNTFGIRGATEGSAKYIVGLALDVMNDRYSSESMEFATVSKEYRDKYAGGSVSTGGSGVVAPVVAVTSGDEYDVTDLTDEEEERYKEMEAARKAEIEEDIRNYTETLQGLKDTTLAMCNYVKNNGKLDDDDASILSRRGILLTGKGGIGKSYTVIEALEEKGMVENKDYKWLGNGSTSPREMYSVFYDYNGKLIVFDDAPNLFAGDYRESFWKYALQTEISQAKIQYPTGKEGAGMNVYRADDVVLQKDRQKRYFLEIGRKSNEERSEFFKREMKKNNLEPCMPPSGAEITGIKGFKRVRSKDALSDSEVQQLMYDINDEWKEEERNAKPAKPNEFIFNGVVIVITNVGRDRFIADLGKNSWDAIESRFTNYDLSPMVESLWFVIKGHILEEYNNKELDDRMRMIPAAMTEEFIAEVEMLIADPSYQKLTWRGIRAFSRILRGAPGLRTWKNKLRNELKSKA